MIRSPIMRIRFRSFEIDDERLLLTRDGVAIALRPKVFDLLLVLVRERARVVRREELFERLWSTTAVGFGSLSGLVNELRGALGECGRGPSSIRTVHARGYQFVAPAVEVADLDAPREESVASVVLQTPRQSDREGEVGPVRSSYPTDRIDRTVADPGPPAALGARAFFVCLLAAAERSAWLAQRASEARSAGYRPRFATARSRGAEADRGMGVREGDFDGAATGAEARAASANDPRAPIALLLDIEGPEVWQRAGGMRRLLDLFGRTPVLVLAAIAAVPADPVVSALLGGDSRIERFDRPIAPLPCRPGGGLQADGGFDDDAAAIARMLRGLARASGRSFEVALRSLGFEAVRFEPIRSLRRVEPTSGVGGGSAYGPQARREPGARRRGP